MLKGQIIFDKDGAEVEILDLTPTSVRLFIKAKTDKGIDSKDWMLLDKNFYTRFNTK